MEYTIKFYEHTPDTIEGWYIEAPGRVRSGPYSESTAKYIAGYFSMFDEVASAIKASSVDGADSLEEYPDDSEFN